MRNLFGIPRININGFDLKVIAIITMFIDHVGVTVIWRCYQLIGRDSVILENVYEVMRLIGRMAFPLFCFLLVEGFLHTKSVGKYALRLSVFALLSEIPFDLAVSGKCWNMGDGNAFFTLLLGLLAIWGLSYVELLLEFWREKKLDGFLGWVIALTAGFFIVAPACFLAEHVVSCEYKTAGVLTIVAMYLFRKNRYIAYTLGILILGIFVDSNEYLALLMLYPLYLYDGTRGYNLKYVFYAFYPVHLAILGLVTMLLGQAAC